jgi:transcriptional regulator with XRE-family HTH domain
MKARLKQIRSRLGLKQSDVARTLGCGAANIAMIETGKSALSERNKKALVQKFNLNPEWFSSDDVPMLAPTAEHAAMVQRDGGARSASVPLFDIERIPDLASLFRYTSDNEGRIGKKRGRPGRKSNEQHAFEPTGFISIPGLPRADGALRIAGGGMAPAIGSGDIVIYKQLDTPAEIIPGEMYLLSVNSPMGEYVAVRYLHRSEKEGFVVMSGENPGFADTEVALADITAIALVKASVRMNCAK